MKMTALLALAALATAAPAHPSSWTPSLRACFGPTGALDEACWAARIASLRALVVHDNFETAIRQLQVPQGDAPPIVEPHAEEEEEQKQGHPIGPLINVPITPPRHKAGMRCAGAPGFPLVEYLGCEDGYECTGAAQDWGKICVLSASASAPATATPAGAATQPAPPAQGPCFIPPEFENLAFFRPNIQQDARYYCQCGRTCRHWETFGGQAVC